MKLILILSSVLSFSLIFLSQLSLAESPVTIGVSIPLTGPVAAGGEAMRDGILTAQKHFKKDLGIQFVFEDNEYTGNGGIRSFRALKEQHRIKALIIFGGPAVLVVRQSVEAEKFPTLALSAAVQLDSGGNGSITRIWESARSLGNLFGQIANQSNSKKIALVSSESEVGLGIRDAMKKSSREAPVFDELIPPSEQDFSTLAVKLRSIQPDLVLINLIGGQATTFFRKLREQRITSPVAFHSGLFFAAEARVPFGKEYSGSYVATVNDDKAQDLYRELRAQGKTSSAIYTAAVAYDAASFLAGLVEKNWDFTVPLPIENPSGVLGEYSKIAERSFEPAMRMMRVEAGNLVIE